MIIHPNRAEDDPMNTIPDQEPNTAHAMCFVCLGEQTDPATGERCKRCGGIGWDPDPAAPTGIPVAS